MTDIGLRPARPVAFRRLLLAGLIAAFTVARSRGVAGRRQKGLQWSIQPRVRLRLRRLSLRCRSPNRQA